MLITIALPQSALAQAGPADSAIPATQQGSASSPRTIPAQLDDRQRQGYRAIFAAIRARQWSDARRLIDEMPAGPLHAVALAELLTAKGSPKAPVDPLVKLLSEAPELPHAQTILTLARSRGAKDLPPLPAVKHLAWLGSAPARVRARSVRSDMVAAELAIKMQPFIKADDGPGAQALLEATPDLSPEALTEWQQKVSWIYFHMGDDANARAMAEKAATGTGDWAVQGQWVAALAAWRQRDCEGAGSGFASVAARAGDDDMRAAGLYWAARADTACGHAERVEVKLRGAAQYRETFYGLLAREALGLGTNGKTGAAAQDADAEAKRDWARLQGRRNVRLAAALSEIDEQTLADAMIRQEARIGSAADYPALVRLAGQLNLPATSLWLAHNGPAGATPPVEARYPVPDWTPDGGWRVDRALVLAHTLQESRFRTDALSSAGAYGLMQIRPIAATDIARRQGRPASWDRSALTRPSTNIEVGQSYIEQLRDLPVTGGLLPKVIAAYNAGPSPVEAWNTSVRDGGDPLLYIESIPYWETRGYVVTVLRNYWMYEAALGRTSSPSRNALAQGQWPRFPSLTPFPARNSIASASGRDRNGDDGN